MQNSRTTIRGSLIAAVCGLLGAGAQAAVPQNLPPIDIGSAVLYYGETDRVKAVETVVNASAQVGDERYVRTRFVFDTLTGASANGATPAGRIQTFTRPSGLGSYQSAAGKTPLDDTFRDTRYAGTIGYDTPLGRLYHVSASANGSTEHDYRSLGLSTVLSRDLNLRNTTLTLGLSGSLDKVSPVGGPPAPLASMRSASGDGGGGDDKVAEDDGIAGGSKTKKVYDVLFGVTQVLNRSALMQANYSYSRSTGYLNDPYKFISMVRASGPDVGDPVDYLYENRPDARSKQSLYWEGKYTPGTDVLSLSYRYMWDDWSIRSNTIDLHYRWQLAERTWVEPQLRWYEQSAASFFRRYLLDSPQDPSILPQYVSADYRLAEMDTITEGLKVGHALGEDREVTLRIERYSQTGEGHPPDAIGSMRTQDLFPSVNAFILQVGFSAHL